MLVDSDGLVSEGYDEKDCHPSHDDEQLPSHTHFTTSMSSIS